MTLKKYQEKRDFKKTPEPKGKKVSGKKTEPKLLFCVQKHFAKRLHYDFRLEYNGVLLSWAVPKGPSLNPKDKRLAIQVEDHPLDYRTFEGIIPEGNYGAGKVILWDEGAYTVPGAENLKDLESKIAAGLAKGHLEIELHGKKLSGEFDLIRIKSDEKNTWLLVKRKDSHASVEDILTHEDSVKKKALKKVLQHPIS